MHLFLFFIFGLKNKLRLSAKPLYQNRLHNDYSQVTIILLSAPIFLLGNSFAARIDWAKENIAGQYHDKLWRGVEVWPLFYV